jgi:hypothetical protein
MFLLCGILLKKNRRVKKFLLELPGAAKGGMQDESTRSLGALSWLKNDSFC